MKKRRVKKRRLKGRKNTFNICAISVLLMVLFALRRSEGMTALKLACATYFLWLVSEILF
jgi:hypothetical protein